MTEVVPVVVADSWDTPPEDMVRKAEMYARCRIVSHVKELSALAPIPKSSAETSTPIEPPKLRWRVSIQIFPQLRSCLGDIWCDEGCA